MTGAAYLPIFRKALRIPAFDEGWAHTAETLAWEMGFYADDPNANLGRLQQALIRVAQLVDRASMPTAGRPKWRRATWCRRRG
jgi:uncharacterized protein (DUF885 family)